MEESICKHCGITIYLIDLNEDDPVPSRRDIWSANKIWYEIWCAAVPSAGRHEPVSISTLEEKKYLLAVKEIMHRDLMQEIEELRRDIAAEEIKKWQGRGVKA